MLDKPIRPVLFVTFEDIDIDAFIVVPDNTLPMDLYNALYKTSNLSRFAYGWITNRGRIITGEEAAKIAFDLGLIDTRVDRLKLVDYKGSWKGHIT